MTIETVIVTLAAPPGVQVIATQPQRQEVSPSVFRAGQSEWLGSTEPSHEDSQECRESLREQLVDAGSVLEEKTPASILTPIPTEESISLEALRRQIGDIAYSRDPVGINRSTLGILLHGAAMTLLQIKAISTESIPEIRQDLGTLLALGIVEQRVSESGESVFQIAHPGSASNEPVSTRKM